MSQFNLQLPYSCSSLPASFIKGGCFCRILFHCLLHSVVLWSSLVHFYKYIFNQNLTISHLAISKLISHTFSMLHINLFLSIDLAIDSPILGTGVSLIITSVTTHHSLLICFLLPAVPVHLNNISILTETEGSVVAIASLCWNK